MHILIVGSHKTWRSELIDYLLVRWPEERIQGYRSAKEAEDTDGACPIYLRDIGVSEGDGTLVGWCKDQTPTSIPAAFEAWAPRLRVLPRLGITVLDEIGTMERDAPLFCEAILGLLNDMPFVLAAVRDKDTPFLQKVKSHPRVQCFFLTEDNHPAIYGQIIAALEEEGIR